MGNRRTNRVMAVLVSAPLLLQISTVFAQSVYEIDGKSYTGFADLPDLKDGDTIHIAPNYVVYGETFILRDLQSVTIRSSDPTAGKWIKRNAMPLSIAIPVNESCPGEFDVFRTNERDVQAEPVTLWENWDDPSNRDEHGFRTAFVPRIQGGPDQLSSTRGWWWDPDSLTLYVSVPAGESAANRQYLVGTPGHGIVLQNCTGVLIEDGCIEITTEPGPGRGYGILEGGSSTSNTVRNCDFRAFQYHGLGSLAIDPDLQSISNRFFEHVANTDSQLVFYANGGRITAAKSIDDEFHLVPWLTVNGAPHAEGNSVAIASHHAAGSIGTDPGGVEIINPTVKVYRYNESQRRIALLISANGSQHTQPSDPFDPEAYPVIVRGGHVEGTGVAIGGGDLASVAAAFVGTRFTLDASKLRVPLAVGGLLGVTSSHPTESQSTLGIFACTVSATLSEMDPSHRVLFARSNGARLIVENSTIWIPGSSAFTQRILGLSNSVGLIHVTGSIFGAGTPGVQLMSGGDRHLRDDPARFHWSNNLYSTDLHDNFNPSVPAITRATFEDHFDPTGVYDVRPTFLNPATLEPTAETKKHKSEFKLSGPSGINHRSYDRTFGAWQFGPSLDCPPDLAEPYGTLNFFDLAAYIALYTAQDPGADLAAPFGTFNFFDLAAYIGSYNAGCP